MAASLTIPRGKNEDVHGGTGTIEPAIRHSIAMTGRVGILDVTFREDASRIRQGNGPEISSVFRRLALNILQRDTSLKGSLRSKRKRCGWCERTFEQLLAGFAEN
jgi:hypothetical protein